MLGSLPLPSGWTWALHFVKGEVVIVSREESRSERERPCIKQDVERSRVMRRGEERRGGEGREGGETIVVDI